MTLKIGTFNLNNLFSRFDFEADVATAKRSPNARASRRAA